MTFVSALLSVRNAGKNGKNVFISARNKQIVWFRNALAVLGLLLAWVWYSRFFVTPSFSTLLFLRLWQGLLCLQVKEFYGTQYQSGFLFLIPMWSVVFTTCVVFLSILHLFGCMSLGSVARAYGLAWSPVKLRSALAFVADLVWYVLDKFLLAERDSCWVGAVMHLACWIFAVVACWDWKVSKILVKVFSICVSAEGGATPCYTIAAGLPTSACASMQAPWEPFV